jgi:Spy/CpxP family protein refolding chaperone
MKNRDQNQGPSSSVTKGKRTVLFKGIIFLLTLCLLPLFEIQQSKGQPPFVPQNGAALKMDGQETWKSSHLGLTEAQEKTLETLHRAYTSETFPVRMELMSLRFELRHLIRDPNVQSKVLFDRQKKISELQVKLDNRSFSYQIKARSILTKEQLEQLPRDCSLGMSPEYEMLIGIGRRPRRGLR